MEGEWHKHRDPLPVIPLTCPFQGFSLGKSHQYSTQDFFSLYPAKTDAEAGTAWLLTSTHIQTQPSPGHLSHSKCFCLVAKPLRKEIVPGYQQPWGLQNSLPKQGSLHVAHRQTGRWDAQSSEMMCHRLPHREAEVVPLGFQSQHSPVTRGTILLS